MDGTEAYYMNQNCQIPKKLMTANCQKNIHIQVIHEGEMSDIIVVDKTCQVIVS